MILHLKLPQIFTFIISTFVFSFLFSIPAHADHMYDITSGFTKARQAPQQSILVWADPSLSINVPDVIQPWNNLAGWQLLKQVPDQIGADIIFRPDSSIWVEAQPTYRKPFTLCVIRSSGSDTHTYRHEMAHCLGFSDHFYQSLLADPRYNNPDLYGELKICDKPSDPHFSPYWGVASYCTYYYEFSWFKDTDRQMLSRAGYMKQNDPIPTPTPDPSPTPSPSPTPTPWWCKTWPLLCK